MRKTRTCVRGCMRACMRACIKVHECLEEDGSRPIFGWKSQHKRCHEKASPATTPINKRIQLIGLSIGLYRENAIAIERETTYPFGGDMLPIAEFTRTERNLHCDVLHIRPTTDRVARLVLDDAIAAIQTSR